MATKTLPYRTENVGTPSFRRDSVCHEVARQQEAEKQKTWASCDLMTRYYLKFVVLPLVISLVYAVAILFPPKAREKASLLLWTDGALARSIDGTVVLCPRKYICSNGILEIFLISISRLTAFASYVLIGQVFFSKMHSTIYALSTTHVATHIPFPSFHDVHKFMGRCYGGIALLHTVTHIIRWAIRNELDLLWTTVGLSGMVGILNILMTILSMSSMVKKINDMTFELRIFFHWVSFLGLFLALCFHTPRCRIITIIFCGLWCLDYLYGYLFKTHRLEVVEFSPLPSGSGVQMLWTNPPRFNTNSGEYVKVQLPWLLKGGKEWHPFSVYLREETAEGLGEVLRQKFEVNATRVHIGGAKVGGDVNPTKTALLLCECQNEFASENGKIYEDMKSVMKACNMIPNLINLVEYARSMGAAIFHIPIVFDEEGYDNPNKERGILKVASQKNFFTEGTWNAEIIDCLKPRSSDVVVQNKKGLDAFMGSDLQEQLEKRGIETIILGGFRTECCVESTIRTGYEKGYNVIGLIDGCATVGPEEQKAAVEGTWKLFATPMYCFEVMEILSGEVPERFEYSEYSEYSEVCSNYTSDTEEVMEILPGQVPERFKYSDVCKDSEEIATLSERFEYPEVNYTWDTEEIETPQDVVHKDLYSFVTNCMMASHVDTRSFIMEEARQKLRSQNTTTQIFMVPAGDWTKAVYDEVTGQRQLRSCWVKGPFVSPFAVVSRFSHLVLIASGIGITPALGVMGQYKGKSRTKVLIWSTRCKNMMKFFTPLFTDATMVIIYYTGTEKLSDEEIERLKSGGNVYIQQSRPRDLTETVSTVIVVVTALMNSGDYRITTNMVKMVNDIPPESRKQWCMFYCGGSKKIRDIFSNYSKKVDVEFEYELFDW